MKEKQFYIVVFVLLVVANNLFCLPDAGAKSIAVDATWRASMAGGEQDDIDQDVFSRYNQRYFVRWLPLFTQRISLQANFEYNHNWATGQSSSEYISPRLNVTVNNDLFTANFFGYRSASNRSEGADLDTRYWSGEIASNWNYYLWPVLVARIGQTWRSDRENIKNVDESNIWAEASVDWEYKNLRTYYNYYQSKNTNEVNFVETESYKHFARLDYSDRFWSNRLVFDFSQQFSSTENKVNSLDGGSGDALVSLTVSQGRAGIDATPESGALPVRQALINGNTTVPAVTIRPNEPMNLAVKPDFQSVDSLYVYTTRDQDLIVADTTQVTWDVYTSNDGVLWERSIIGAPSIYNQDEFRFEVETGRQNALFVKLVITGWFTILNIDVTELEAYQRLSAGSRLNDSTQSTTYKTNLTLGINPTISTWFTYNLNWDKTDNDTGNNRDRLNQAANLRWSYSRYFEPSFSVSSQVVDNTQTVDRENRSYGVNILSRPLDTYQTTVGVTHYESFEDDEAVSKTLGVNWSNSATLYPGLSSNLNFNYNIIDNLEGDSTSNVYNINLNILSRMRDNLMFDFVTEYGSNDIEYVTRTGDTRTSGGSTALKLTYYPSEMLSFLLVGTTSYGDRSDDFSSLLFDATLTLLRTRKTVLSTSYRVNTTNLDTIQNANINHTWNLSDYFTLVSNANYYLSEKGDIWSLDTRLNAAF